jgi:DNA adenine methylase Dam
MPTIGPFPLDRVHKTDCVQAMSRLPAESIDLAIADPPYNASKGNVWKWDNRVKLPGFGGDWSKVMAEWDDLPLADYLAFTLRWLAELKRVVRPTGSIWIHGTYHNIGVINFACQLLEIELINEVVWYKRNSFPNLSGRRLTASHETILWAHTGGAKSRRYRFNYKAAKQLEFPEDALKAAGKQMRTVWDVPNNKEPEEIRFGKHPTQKPLRLLKRMIALSASPGDVLLSPFAGAGSDCVAAAQMGLRFLGFETDRQYVELANTRIKVAKRQRVAGVERSSTPVEQGLASSDPSHPSYRRSSRTIPSLVKWTGSKRSQAAAIFDLLPEHKRYVEPFLGGGALLFLAGGEGAIGGDVYAPLIELWKLVKHEPEELCENYDRQWRSLQGELKTIDAAAIGNGGCLPRYYYRVRERFNRTHDPRDLNFLMRTCVNGIVRFNDAGEFNNSFHLSRPGMDPRRFRASVQRWSQTIARATFVCQDYEATVAGARRGDFVYFDPPYAGNHQRYTANLDLTRFFSVLDRLTSRGVKWALSFDGHRGNADLTYKVPSDLFRRHVTLRSGNSAVTNVLNGAVKAVRESLYLNY